MRALRSLGFFINTLVMYLGLPLLGWGVDDLGGFFSLSQRLGYTVLVVALGLAVAYQAFDAPEGITGSKGKKGKLVHRQSIIWVAGVLLLFAALMFLSFADRRNVGVIKDGQAARWAGLAFFGLGSGLVFWSGVALGRLYSGEVTLQEDHQLITSGLYHYVRHPRYLGAELLVIGLSLVFRSWIGLIASVAVLGALLFRIRDEEALMHKEFEQEWEAYCKHSWRLIPFLY
jgi:protein-S-isoprenylcysteine O-methyltransferase Ste14